ncbi:uncharacterized protein Dana_GF19765 [Drosophila ananassae]|uniref:Ionotropic glutamate receptor C-terminal domain-containing protein n=1 Tax=Drosophila ananassae TaxID=7217 RepID=B3MFT9_DROAN|nr:uncharacterized protein LOC6502508 [Drosophila ananassae]EDV37779.2 uncharacterized protein Dana_GF19765 [Drosophila ananassae]
MYLWLQCLIFLKYVGASGQGPIQAIQKLNNAFQMELNVFIDCEDWFRFQDESIFQILDTPRILFTKSDIGNYRIYGNFTEKTLIVVFFPEAKNSLDPLVTKLLSNLVDNLHEIHVVFVAAEEPDDSWKMNLYTFCYKEGLINVILIYNENIYSYLPYPKIQPIRLANISEYFERKRILSNLRGLPIRTVRIDISPGDFEYLNQDNETIRVGTLFFALREFTDRYNATILGELLPSVQGFDVYVELSKMLYRKEIDVICYLKDLNIPSPYTKPLSILSEHFIVPYARPIGSYLYYYKPFEWTLWMAVAGTVVYGTLMLYIMSRRVGIEFGQCLLYSLSHILFTCNHANSSTGWRVKVVEGILILGGFVLTNLYLSTLSSILTLGLYEPEYNTLEDLAKAPYPSLHDAFYVENLKSKTFLPEALRKNAINPNNNTLLRIYRDNLNESYMYVMYDGRRELNLMQQRLLKTPRFHTVEEPIGFALNSIPVSKSLPYLNILNQFMRRLQEHGIFIKIKADVFQVMIEQGIYTLMRDNEPPAKPFDLEYYFFAFALWAVGLFISLLFFLAEILRISYKTWRV